MPRPKEAILSRSLIRDQALAIIDENGLDALTMRELAARLGVQAASLYTHFPNKNAVLDAVADRLAARIDPADAAGSWQDVLRAWANSFYTAIHWHPNAAPVLAARSRDTDEPTAATDGVQQVLVDRGWPADQALTVTTAVKLLVLGAASGAAGAAVPDDTEDDDDPLGQFADTVERAAFSLGLDAMVRGFEATFAEVSARPRRRLRASAG